MGPIIWVRGIAWLTEYFYHCKRMKRGSLGVRRSDGSINAGGAAVRFKRVQEFAGWR
jgi:hypothetical protein